MIDDLRSENTFLMNEIKLSSDDYGDEIAVLESIHLDLSIAVEVLQAQHAACLEELLEAAKFYVFDCTDKNPEELFQAVDDFRVKLLGCHAELQQRGVLRRSTTVGKRDADDDDAETATTTLGMIRRRGRKKGLKEAAGARRAMVQSLTVAPAPDGDAGKQHDIMVCRNGANKKQISDAEPNVGKKKQVPYLMLQAARVPVRSPLSESFLTTTESVDATPRLDTQRSIITMESVVTSQSGMPSLCTPRIPSASPVISGSSSGCPSISCGTPVDVTPVDVTQVTPRCCGRIRSAETCDTVAYGSPSMGQMETPRNVEPQHSHKRILKASFGGSLCISKVPLDLAVAEANCPEMYTARGSLIAALSSVKIDSEAADFVRDVATPRLYPESEENKEDTGVCGYLALLLEEEEQE